ncbi:hypothetical protein BCR39DRAFT_511644 [Naematelia encephala]|uniref:AB hydrolase-1 domain-containing protein n=1 Tax=Naematelia encephala TaxID=71784 RepID=A0A1Y2BNH2_9TREE|nr:hypothetical protein BCR39DRAFT_511644 [Naematelia encephala]
MSCKVEYDDARNYFCPRNFSLRLAKCPRTQLPVSYCDIGDPEGIPVLNIVPSACSRWVAAIQDPLCRLYGIRMIAIDRPGCGVTPAVPISQRIQLSAQMAVSVLEHIGVKPRHILVTSAGI